MRAADAGGRRIGWWVSLAFLVLTGAARAGAPEIAPGQKIYDGEAPLMPGIYIAPTAADWNNDGRTDLIAGQYTGGYIYLYLNSAGEGLPVFNGGARIQSSGSSITTSYG